MELFKATLLEIVADDGDACRIGACELAEAGDGKEHILERVERCIFGRSSRERICLREKARNACEAQIRLCLGRRAQRRGVASMKEGNERGSLESRGRE